MAVKHTPRGVCLFDCSMPKNGSFFQKTFLTVSGDNCFSLVVTIYC